MLIEHRAAGKAVKTIIIIIIESKGKEQAHRTTYIMYNIIMYTRPAQCSPKTVQTSYVNG